MNYLKKTFLKQLTTVMILILFFTSITLPIPSFAEGTDTTMSVSDSDSDSIIISRIWKSTTYDIPFEYDVALDDCAGYATILQNMQDFADSYAGIYELDGSMDYCTLEIAWSGNGTTDNKLPEVLPASAGDSFPVTLTYTGTLQEPEGYTFSEEIDTDDFIFTLTLHVYETTEALPQIPLCLPDDVAFYMGTGLNYSPEMPLEEITEELNSFSNVRFYFLTENDMEIYPTEIQWDLTDIIAGIPGTYTAKATFTLPLQYTLPENAIPLSIPIHIRDDASLEIHLDSVYSDFWGTVYYGGVYLPKDAEAIEGYLSGYFAYCGEDKPTADQLDALTFTQATEEDETIYFFEVYGYGYHTEYEDTSIYIDLSCMPNPEQQGWYAFYVETAGYVSNYILLNTRHPATLVDNVEGTRGGDTNSNFPNTEQLPPSITPLPTNAPMVTTAPSPEPTNTPEASTATAVPTLEPTNTPAASTATAVPAPEPTNTPMATTAIAVSTPEPTNTPAASTDTAAHTTETTSSPAATSSPMEQETADSVTLSGVRINTLIKANNALIISKNAVTAHLSTETLAALELNDDDFLSVVLTWPQKDTLNLTVTINGTQPATLPDIELTLSDILYDEASHMTISHASGEQIPCYAINGHLAFRTKLPGDYTLTMDTTEPNTLSPMLFGIIGVAFAILLFLSILLLKHRRNQE